MDADVIAYVDRALSRGERVALAMLTRVEASSPGVAGSMMAVLADGAQCGTLGGGAIEAEVSRRCRDALATGGGDFEFAYDLSNAGALGMACGGAVQGFVKLLAGKPRMLLVGGGHIGRALCRMGLVCGFDVDVIDDRALDPGDFEGARTRFGCDVGTAAREARAQGAYVLIATHGHAHDYEALSALVDAGAAYVGMIGSRGKVAQALARLRAEGASEDALARLYAPVGLDIDDGSPGEIAAAVLAEMLVVKNGGRLRHSRERMGERGGAEGA